MARLARESWIESAHAREREGGREKKREREREREGGSEREMIPLASEFERE